MIEYEIFKGTEFEAENEGIRLSYEVISSYSEIDEYIEEEFVLNVNLMVLIMMMTKKPAKLIQLDLSLLLKILHGFVLNWMNQNCLLQTW